MAEITERSIETFRCSHQAKALEIPKTDSLQTDKKLKTCPVMAMRFAGSQNKNPETETARFGEASACPFESSVARHLTASQDKLGQWHQRKNASQLNRTMIPDASQTSATEEEPAPLFTKNWQMPRAELEESKENGHGEEDKSDGELDPAL